MTVPRRYTDRELYEAAARLGDQTAAATALGVDSTWVGKCARRYAAANGLPVPSNRTGHFVEPPRVRRVPAPDTFSHRRLRDGGVRVREQRRAQVTAQGGPSARVPRSGVTAIAEDCSGLATVTARAVIGESTQVRQNRSWPPA